MKKIVSQITFVGLLFFFLLGFSCSISVDPGIVGTWELVSITNGGPTQTVSELGITQTFTFDEEGNFSRTTNGTVTGEGTYTYNTSNGFLALTPDTPYNGDISLGSGTSSVINNVFDRGYFDPQTNSNVAEIYTRG